MSTTAITPQEPTQSESGYIQPTVASVFDEPEEQDQPSTQDGLGEETGTEGSHAEGEETSEDSNWLPDTQLREFPPEVIAKYAKRYGYSQEEIAADPRLARALKDKINSDVEIANRKKLDEEQDQEAEEVEEQPVEAEPTQLDPATAYAQVTRQLETMVDEITDPKMVDVFMGRLEAAEKLTDPAQRKVAVTKALTFGMANALRDLLPKFLDSGNWLNNQIAQHISQNFEGLGEQTLTTMKASTWDSVRQSDPKYASLPAYGTPAFQAAAEKLAQMVPGFENAVFTDKNGRQLSKSETFAKKCQIGARLLSQGTAASPKTMEVVKTAIETGKRSATESAQRKSNARLGAGQSKGLTQKLTNNDDLFGSPGEVQVTQRLVGKQQS